MKSPIYTVEKDIMFKFEGRRGWETQPFNISLEWWVSPPRRRTVILKEDKYNNSSIVTVVRDFPAMAFGRIRSPFQTFSIGGTAAMLQQQLVIFGSPDPVINLDTPVYPFNLPHCSLNGVCCVGSANFILERDVEEAFFGSAFMAPRAGFAPNEKMLLTNENLRIFYNGKWTIAPSTLKDISDIFLSNEKWPSRIFDLRNVL